MRDWKTLDDQRFHDGLVTKNFVNTDLWSKLCGSLFGSSVMKSPNLPKCNCCHSKGIVQCRPQRDTHERNKGDNANICLATSMTTPRAFGVKVPDSWKNELMRSETRSRRLILKGVVEES